MTSSSRYSARAASSSGRSVRRAQASACAWVATRGLKPPLYAVMKNALAGPRPAIKQVELPSSRLLVIEHRAATERPRYRALVRDGGVDVGLRAAALLDRASECVEARHAVELVGMAQASPGRARVAEPRSIRRRRAAAQGTDGRPCRHARRRSAPGSSNRVGVPCTTSAIRASDCSVRGPSCSSSRNEAKSRKSRSCASASTAPSRFSLTSDRAHVVVRRHLETTDLGERACRIVARDRQQRLLRRSRPPIDEVPDRAGVLADDGGVRIGGEVADGCRMPVIAAGEPARFVHSLLHDRPLAVGRQDERVQIDLEAVGDGVVVDARGQSAGADQRIAVEAGAMRDVAQLVRRLARLPPAAAADVDAELVRPWIESLASARPSPMS